MDYSEANDFSNFLKNNRINHQFIYGLMDEEKEKIINKFENEHCLLISTYDCLKEIYFNFINYKINKLNVVVAFKTPYIEKINNCITKIASQNKKIELNGIIINNGVNQEDFLSNYYNIENEINEYKKIAKIALYQNILIKFLNSNQCKNIIKSHFLKMSLNSFIYDSINFFRYKWCEYYDKSKNEVNVFEFLKSINLGVLIFFINDFDKYIQNEFLDIMIIFNLFYQLNIIHPEYTITISKELNYIANSNNEILSESNKFDENINYGNNINNNYDINIENNNNKILNDINKDNEINNPNPEINKFSIEKHNFNNNNLNLNVASNININELNEPFNFENNSDTTCVPNLNFINKTNNINLENNNLNINCFNDNQNNKDININIENDKNSYLSQEKKATIII